MKALSMLHKNSIKALQKLYKLHVTFKKVTCVQLQNVIE